MPAEATNPNSGPANTPGRGPIRDDAGRRTGLLTIGDLRRAARDRPELRLTADRLRYAIKSEKYNMGAVAQARSLVAVLAVVFGAPILAQVLQLMMPGLMGLGPAVLLSYVVTIAVVIVVSRSLFRNRSRKQVAYTAVAEGVCGSCAFSLEGSPVVRAVTPRCPHCRAPISVFSRCSACRAKIDRPAAEESDCVSCGECGSLWLKSRITRPHWDVPVHRSIRSLWYAWLLPGLRPRHASIAPDDRGRFVYVPDARLLRVPGEVWPRLGKTRRKLARHTRHVGWVWRAGTALPFGLLTALLLVLMGIELSHYRPDFEYVIGMALLAVLFVIPFLASIFSALGRPPRTTARRLADLGLCGSCLEPLAGLTPDDAGFVDCLTCGASWRPSGPTEGGGPPGPGGAAAAPPAIPSTDGD